MARQLLLLRFVPIDARIQVRPDHRWSEPSRTRRDLSRGLEPHSTPVGGRNTERSTGESACFFGTSSLLGVSRGSFFSLPDPGQNSRVCQARASERCVSASDFRCWQPALKNRKPSLRAQTHRGSRLLDTPYAEQELFGLLDERNSGQHRHVDPVVVRTTQRRQQFTHQRHDSLRDAAIDVN